MAEIFNTCIALHIAVRIWLLFFLACDAKIMQLCEFLIPAQSSSLCQLEVVSNYFSKMYLRSSFSNYQLIAPLVQQRMVHWIGMQAKRKFKIFLLSSDNKYTKTKKPKKNSNQRTSISVSVVSKVMNLFRIRRASRPLPFK